MSVTSKTLGSSPPGNLDEKYFGENSKRSFVDTYRQLKKHGELLAGGYEELEELITKPMSQNVLARSVEELKLAGVLTPRAEPASRSTTPPKRTNKFKLADDEEEGTFLTKIGGEGEDDESVADGDSVSALGAGSAMPRGELDGGDSLGT
eukprot:CAMPEP_0173315982 /NCGR_PEP_ID=MMETSP1143-20121109/26235_1 /TAXON_ID=483371 /ORGANISM="non described non described, Strain CCMP2298" /LENGTH=149 /DNA_ID=CAMNT_0014258839 /DNA_START=77 /DNA_END=522 /DNA_ORIENTATION=+